MIKRPFLIHEVPDLPKLPEIPALNQLRKPFLIKELPDSLVLIQLRKP